MAHFVRLSNHHAWASVHNPADQRGRTALVFIDEIESQEGGKMDASVGDRIVVESERAAQSGQAGVIEAVLAQDPPRFRVRWDDGRTSIFAPSAGVARIERSKTERVKA
jgi:ribosomal protein L14